MPELTAKVNEYYNTLYGDSGIRNNYISTPPSDEDSRENFLIDRENLVKEYYVTLENELESFKARRISEEDFGKKFDYYKDEFEKNLNNLKNIVGNDNFDGDSSTYQDAQKKLRISDAAIFYLIIEYHKICKDMVDEIRSYNAPNDSNSVSNEELDKLQRDTQYKILKNKENLDKKRQNKLHIITVLIAINFILLALTVFLIFNI